MSEQILLLSMAIPFGLLGGLLMAMPISLILTLSFPILLTLEPNYAIAFYAIVAITTQFTNSVMALYAGIPGDISALPIISERKRLSVYFTIKENLQRTAVASGVGVIIGIFYLTLVFEFISPFTNYLIRSDFIFLILISVLIILLFWPGNKLLTNAFLIFAGGVIGMVGYHHTLKTTFLTFDNPILYGGLPFIAGFCGMYAVPNILSLSKFYAECSNEKTGSDKKITSEKYRISTKNLFFTSIMGSLAGVIGLIPLIGTSISSNFLYRISKKFTNSPIKLAALSESCNSSAHILVLSPLLFFGIAIVPSEMVLLSAIETNAWRVSHVTTETFSLLIITASITLVISYFFSTTFSKILVELLKKYVKYSVPILLIVLTFNVYFVGSLTKEIEIYIITFILSAVVGIILDRLNISSLPLIIFWAVSESIINVGLTVKSLYF